MRAARAMGSTLGLIAAIGLLIAVAVWGRAGSSSTPVGAVGSPAPPASTPSSPIPRPSLGLGLACGTFTTEVLRYNAPVSALANMSDAVIVGTIRDIDQGRWATSDGAQPELPEGQRPTALDVYRTLTVDVDAVAKGTGEPPYAKGSAITVRLAGGTIGCRTFVLSGQAMPNVGEKVALFLASTETKNVALPNPIDVVEMWPIQDGIASDQLHSIAVDDLLAQVQASN